MLMIVAGTSIHAQYGRMMMPAYDSGTEVTIKGTVEKPHRFAHGKMPANRMGMFLTVKSDNETIEVHLGPAAFVEKTMTFREGDAVEVVGSKVTMMGRTALLVREIRKDNRALKLRDSYGAPVWFGMHRSVPEDGAIEEQELCLPDFY